jgi:L-rhamnose mutarotase
MRGIFFYPLVFIFLFVILLSYTTEGVTMNDKGEEIQKRQGSLIKVRPEFEERYIILHRNTFPGVLASIKRSNIRNYSIFLLDGILFSYFEYVGPDYDADMKTIGDAITKDWWKLTDPMQEPLSTRKEGEWWAEMEQVMLLPDKIKDSPEVVRVGLRAEIIPGKEGDIKRLCGNFPAALAEETYKTGFQNCNIYMKDGRLYYYYEYAGNDIRAAFDSLNRNNEFNNFGAQLNKYLVSGPDGYWQIMKEVFHTD